MEKRIFVAVSLPDAVKEYLKTMQGAAPKRIKVMKAENFHVTLNFLGELAPWKVSEAKTIIEDVCADYRAFALTLGRWRKVREMLWLLPEEETELLNLQSELKNAFAEANLGKRERRPYAPHILVAKTRDNGWMNWMPEGFEAQRFEVLKAGLFESELTPGSATHLLIQEFPLNAN